MSNGSPGIEAYTCPNDGAELEPGEEDTLECPECGYYRGDPRVDRDPHVVATESEDEAYKLIGNSKIVLWDIDHEDLTTREEERLNTIIGKIDELEDIVAERLTEEATEVDER